MERKMNNKKSVDFLLEFGAQLPPEGGTFYTHDAADLSRPYYKVSWAPLLEAAALWLGYKTLGAAKTDPYEPDNVYSNHFFLVFGTSQVSNRFFKYFQVGNT